MRRTQWVENIVIFSPMQPSKIHRGGRAILAASFGNLLEWYDFAVYAAFAIYIGANFFPHDSAAAGLVNAFLVFAWDS